MIPIANPRTRATTAAVVTRRKVVGIASNTATATGSDVRVCPRSNLPTNTPKIPLSQMKYRTGGGRSKRSDLVICAMRASASGSLLARSSPTGSPEIAARLKSKKLEPKRMTPRVPSLRIINANIAVMLPKLIRSSKRLR